MHFNLIIVELSCRHSRERGGREISNHLLQVKMSEPIVHSKEDLIYFIIFYIMWLKFSWMFVTLYKLTRNFLFRSQRMHLECWNGTLFITVFRTYWISKFNPVSSVAWLGTYCQWRPVYSCLASCCQLGTYGNFSHTLFLIKQNYSYIAILHDCT